MNILPSRHATGRWLIVVAALAAAPSLAQPPAKGTAPRPGGATARSQQTLVQLDFNDVDLPVVIDTIARLTGKNFIYDDRVRGRVTIVSPTKIPVEQAFAVFESVLEVKGFTTVPGPGGTIKIIPVREAKESSVETLPAVRRPPPTDRYVTRLIPLRFIDADTIANTLRPLVSKDAALVAYAPTNTLILTDTGANIRRILSILDAIDVETYKQELAVIRLRHADASTLADQISAVFEATTATVSPALQRTARRLPRPPTGTSAAGGRGQPKILTDERTNSLIVLASRAQLDEIRSLVRKLDVPVTGGGRIQVYYLKYADAEDLAETLNKLLSGQPAAKVPGGARGARAEALRAAVAELAGGVSVTADPSTNSLLIQASPEGYAALARVIEQLDIPRRQVLVEALILEVDVTDSKDLGFNGIARFVRGDTDVSVQSGTDSATTNSSTGALIPPGFAGSVPFLTNLLRDTRAVVGTDAAGNPLFGNGTLIQTILRAAASDNRANILSAPHILTSDNEEAEILVGNNIPIITSRVQSAAGVTQATDQLATSVNVERQDIGVSLRVTPQITEGDTLRLKIFQEITDVNRGLIQAVGNPEEVGVALSNRKIQNNVVVADGETVVIGGLISNNAQDTVTKVPWLGDIPILGWLFRTTSKQVTKTNLLVFLTPHIIRTANDLERESIRKREEFRRHSAEALGEKEEEKKPEKEEKEERKEKEEKLEKGAEGVGIGTNHNPTRAALRSLERRYPLERMREIEREQAERRKREAEAARKAPKLRYEILAGVFTESEPAQRKLTELIDAGYDGTLRSLESEGKLRFEIHLGPFATLDEAQQAATIVREGYGLAPRILVLGAPQP